MAAYLLASTHRALLPLYAAIFSWNWCAFARIKTLMANDSLFHPANTECTKSVCSRLTNGHEWRRWDVRANTVTQTHWIEAEQRATGKQQNSKNSREIHQRKHAISQRMNFILKRNKLLFIPIHFFSFSHLLILFALHQPANTDPLRNLSAFSALENFGLLENCESAQHTKKKREIEDEL